MYTAKEVRALAKQKTYEIKKENPKLNQIIIEKFNDHVDIAIKNGWTGTYFTMSLNLFRHIEKEFEYVSKLDITKACIRNYVDVLRGVGFKVKCKYRESEVYVEVDWSEEEN
jgi:hypothetical protein